MTDQSEVHPSTLIRYSEILRQQVLDSATLEPLGRVDTLWMYPQVNRVLGIICKPSLFGQARLVLKLPQVQSIKTNVLVEGAAEETVTSKVTQLESLIGTSVWSDSGELVGQITDCLFDLKSGVIIRYLLVPEGQVPSVVARLTEGTYLLSPKQIKSFSRQRVLIEDDTVQNLRLYSEGLRLKLGQLSATLQQDYWQGATDEWESFSAHLQSVAAQAKDTLLTLAEKAKATAQTLSQTLTQTVADQIDRITDDESDHTSASIPKHPSAETSEKTSGSAKQSIQTGVIQSEATNGDVFDCDDWQIDEAGDPDSNSAEEIATPDRRFPLNLGEVGRSPFANLANPFRDEDRDNETDHDSDVWDSPAPWDDWDEDPAEPSPADRDVGISVANENAHAPAKDDSPSTSSPAVTHPPKKEPPPIHTETNESDRVSDPNVDLDDPWIT